MGNYISFITCGDDTERDSPDIFSNKSISPFSSIIEETPHKSELLRSTTFAKNATVEPKIIDSYPRHMLRRSCTNSNLIEFSPAEDDEASSFKFIRKHHTRTNSLPKQSFLFKAKEKLRRNTIIFSSDIQRGSSISDESTCTWNSPYKNPGHIVEKNYIMMAEGDQDPIDN